MRTAMKMMAGLVMLTASAAALAQGDWKSERAAGRIGEQADGYLGVVAGGNPALEKLVAAVNAERKKVYFERAGQDTPALLAQVTGCSQITGLGPNEMYRTPAGAWKKRGTGAPELAAVCPR